MAQYDDFMRSHATIAPHGFEAVNQGISGLGSTISDYYMKQLQARQTMQQQMALEAGKAYTDVWAKQQDPMARALMYGKLRELGMAPDDMSTGMGQGGGIESMLKGNPYASTVFPNGFPQAMPTPSQNQPIDIQPNSSYSTPAMPTTGGYNPISSGNQNVVQEKVKMGPFGPMPGEYTNVTAGNELAGNKSYADQVGQAKGKQTIATNMLDNITRNLAADLKSHFIEAGGGGPIRGRITGLSTMAGMSPATFGLKNTVRDSAIAYARDLAGGAQGVQKLFQAIGETIPNVGTTQEQAGTALLQMHLTAAQLQSGIDNLGLSPKDLSNISDADLQRIMAAGTIDRNAETQRFSQVLSTIEPTKVMDMSGNTKSPELNPILKMAGIKNPVSAKASYVRTGTLPDGRKVGQKADGTTEIIGGQ